MAQKLAHIPSSAQRQPPKQSWAHNNYLASRQRQNVKASVTQKNSKMFRPPGLNQVATTNIVKMQYRLQVFGLKTWSRCRVSVVACPARLPNALQVVEMV